MAADGKDGGFELVEIQAFGCRVAERRRRKLMMIVNCGFEMRNIIIISYLTSSKDS